MLIELKPLSRYSFKNAMETRFSPISIGNNCFLSKVVIYSSYCVFKLFNVYHSRRVCKNP